MREVNFACVVVGSFKLVLLAQRENELLFDILKLAQIGFFIVIFTIT